MEIPRYKDSLKCGSWKHDDPEEDKENLVRDPNGAFVRFSDYESLQAEVERLRSIAQRLANGQDGTECKNRAYADLVVYNLEKKAEEKEANDE